MLVLNSGCYVGHSTSVDVTTQYAAMYIDV